MNPRRVSSAFHPADSRFLASKRDKDKGTRGSLELLCFTLGPTSETPFMQIAIRRESPRSPLHVLCSSNSIAQNGNTHNPYHHQHGGREGYSLPPRLGRIPRLPARKLPVVPLVPPSVRIIHARAERRAIPDDAGQVRRALEIGRAHV